MDVDIELYVAYPEILPGPDLWAAFEGRTDLIPHEDVHPNGAGIEELRRQWALTIAQSGGAVGIRPRNAAGRRASFTGYIGVTPRSTESFSSSRSSPSQMSTQTILVCGATGTIGGPTLDELLKRGAAVAALVRDPKEAGALEARGVRPVVVGDLGSVDSIRPALKGVSRVFCLIPGNPYQPDQLQLATNFLKAVEGSDVERIVYHSMWGAGRSVHKPMVMQNHARIEDAILQSKRGYTFLQTMFTMQALSYGQGVARTVATEGRMYTPFGDAGVALVDARDVGRTAAACLVDDSHAGKTYELSGPSVLTSSAMAATLSKVLGRPVLYVPLTVEQAVGAMQQLGLPEWFTSHMAVLAAFNRTGSLARVTSAVLDVTGQAPTTFEQFVRDHVASFTPEVG